VRHPNGLLPEDFALPWNSSTLRSFHVHRQAEAAFFTHSRREHNDGIIDRETISVSSPRSSTRNLRSIPDNLVCEVSCTEISIRTRHMYICLFLAGKTRRPLSRNTSRTFPRGVRIRLRVSPHTNTRAYN